MFRAASVKNFQIPTKASGYVAYLQMPAPVDGKQDAAKSAEPEPADANAPKPKKIETGDLILRNIGQGRGAEICGGLGILADE